MLSLKVLVFFFISKVLCASIYSSRRAFFSGCLQSLQLKLDTKTDTNDLSSFGFVYSLNYPEVDIVPDLSTEKDSFQLEVSKEPIPNRAVVILSDIIYNSYGSKLMIRGLVSNQNADKLRKVSLDKVVTNMKLGAYSYDKSNHQWYDSFKSGSEDGLSGAVSKMDIIYHINRNATNATQEVVFEFSPIESEKENMEHLEFTPSSVSTMNRIEWNRLERNECNQKSIISYPITLNKLHEVIDSAVLL